MALSYIIKTIKKKYDEIQEQKKKEAPAKDNYNNQELNLSNLFQEYWY